MHKEIIIKFTILATFLILIFLNIVYLSSPKITIKKINEEIPKAFVNPSTDLPIKKHRPKEERKEIIPSIVSDKTIYLTFDDGPSYLTNDILNILNKENVPATFFVIGSHIDEYSNTVSRAYNEGHTIGLHTFTHNYKYVYSSDDNYFNDLKQINDKVYNITGHHSRIVRLPGGSSNTVSKKYNKGIVTRITTTLNNNNYYYFDWNVDSGDASGKLTKDQIIHNTKLNLHHGTNIILMHDTAAKKSTVEALPEIIKYAKENGYTFARITKDTMSIRHHINN